MTQIDRSERHLRLQLHAITARLKMSDEEYRAMLYDTYKVESSTSLNAHQLIDLVHTLQQHLPQDTELEKARRRACAAVAAWFRATGYQPADTTAAIRATICQAAQVDNFFRIGREKLTAIACGFSRKAKTYTNTMEMAPVVEMNRTPFKQQLNTL